VSRVSAIPQPRGQWLDDIAARLRTHSWVGDVLVRVARTDHDADRFTVFVLPSAEGVRALRTSGKDRLVSGLQGWLRESGLDEAVRLEWRLVEALPANHEQSVAGDRRRHWMPIVSDLASDERGLSCTLVVPYDLRIFRGHFPGRPIVPGVMQVGWAVTLSRDHGLAEGPLNGIPAAKFNRIVRPGMLLAARIERGLQPGQVQFAYSSRDAAVATGKLQFGAARD
jgi:3-hydroxymyristoyl/3-hydroxydecanoyl-(acyl carrier protein) dehydratase